MVHKMTKRKTQPIYCFHAIKLYSMNPSGWIFFIQTKETFKKLSNWSNKHITVFDLQT